MVAQQINDSALCVAGAAMVLDGPSILYLAKGEILRSKVYTLED